MQSGKVRNGLADRVLPGCSVLFVGINPGLKSARVGHHYAGPGNRFWRLLGEAKLLKERMEPEDDARLPEFGFGLTNLASRPTKGSADLSRRELETGKWRLRTKILRSKPEIVAFVGVTAYRAFFGLGAKVAVRCGVALQKIGGSKVFVLPNTSGRNAHFSYAEMLELFTQLGEEACAISKPGHPVARIAPLESRRPGSE